MSLSPNARVMLDNYKSLSIKDLYDKFHYGDCPNIFALDLDTETTISTSISNIFYLSPREIYSVILNNGVQIESDIETLLYSGNGNWSSLISTPESHGNFYSIFGIPTNTVSFNYIDFLPSIHIETHKGNCLLLSGIVYKS